MEKARTIGELIKTVREHPDELTAGDRNVIVSALQTVEDMYKQGRTATWRVDDDQIGSGMFTPGGNPVYHCDKCGFVYGANEIIPSAKICENCGSLMTNGWR